MDLDRLAAAVRGAARHDHTGGPISYMQEQIRRANVDHAAGREQVFCECITAAQRMAPQLAGRGSMGITTVSARDGGHHRTSGPSQAQRRDAMIAAFPPLRRVSPRP